MTSPQLDPSGENSPPCISRHSQEARDMAAKTMPGHKGRRRVGVEYVCECGWVSCTHYGKGATGQAANEFQMHKRHMLCEAGVLA